MVRCFDDENVVHVSARPNPRDDIGVINTELILADLQQLENRLARLERQAVHDKKLHATVEVAHALKVLLETGKPVAAYPDKSSDAYQAFNNEMRFLTGKTVIFAANVNEADLAEDLAVMERALGESGGGGRSHR